MVYTLEYSSDSAKSAFAEYHFNRADRPIWIELPVAHRDNPFMWWGIRSLLSQLKKYVPEEEIHRQLLQYGEVASIFLPELSSQLTKEQRVKRATLLGDLKSYSTHAYFQKAPFFKRTAALIGDLLSGAEYTIVCPDLNATDRNFLGVMKHVLGQHPELTLHYAFSYDATRSEPEQDRHGIIWGYSTESIRGYLKTYALHGSGGADACAPTEAREPRSTPALEPCSWDSIPELNTERSDAGTLARNAFAAYDFCTALSLSLSCLHNSSGKEVDWQVRCCAANAAHNRQFLAREGDRVFNEYLFDLQFEALINCGELQEKMTLWYRLIVTAARRMNAFDLAHALSVNAIDFALSSGISGAALQRHVGWLRSIKAYIHAKRGEFDLGKREMKNGYFDFRKAILTDTELDSIQKRLYLHECAVFAVNRAHISQILGETADKREWMSLSHGTVGQDPYMKSQFVRIGRLRDRISELQLDKALRIAETGLATAETEMDVRSQYYFHAKLADLLFRVGNGKRASHHIETAIRLGRALELESQIHLRLLQLKVAYRTANADILLSVSKNALEEETLDEGSVTDIMTYRAYGEHLRGQRKRCHETINAVIGRASESGDQDLLICVAARVARILELEGSVDSANQLYQQAVDISSVAGAPPTMNSDLFAVRLRLREKNLLTYTATDMIQYITKNTANQDVWWEINSVKQCLEKESRSLLPPDTLAVFSKMCAQRIDG